MRCSLKKTAGFGLVEILVGVAIIAALAVGLLSIFTKLTQFSQGNLRAAQATLLATEGAEVLRLWRDAGWTNLSALTPGEDYALVFGGGAWSAAAAPVLVDGLFDRRVRAEAVYRDGADNIAPAGTLDPNTLFFTIGVDWRGPLATSTRSVSLYLTNLFDS